MNKIAFTLMLFISANVFASSKTVSSLAEENAKIDVSRVAQTVVLGTNTQKDINVRLVSMELGQSTDVSARYNVMLTFFHAAEMNNTRTAFEIGAFLKVPTAKRISSGVYEIKGQVMNEETSQIENKTLVVNVSQVFIDDRNLKLEEFEDTYFSSTLTVDEK